MQTDETRKINLASALVVVGLCASESESKRLIRGGGVYVNREKAAENGYVRAGDLISAGKKHHAMLAFAASPAVEREGDRWRFARYLNGVRMAEGIAVTLAEDLDTAISKAVGLCPKAPAGCQILVLTHAKGSPTLHPSDREEGLREAAQAVVDNATRSYRSRGKERYIEDESGELMMLVPHEDWYRLEHSLADAILALSGSLAPANHLPGVDHMHTSSVTIVQPCPPHQWAHAPTVGYFICTKCGERVEHSDPRYGEMLAALPPSTEKGETK